MGSKIEIIEPEFGNVEHQGTVLDGRTPRYSRKKLAVKNFTSY
jgi:hypothetical protein